MKDALNGIVVVVVVVVAATATATSVAVVGISVVRHGSSFEMLSCVLLLLVRIVQCVLEKLFVRPAAR